MLNRVLCLIALCLLPLGSMAQTYPDYKSTDLNDFAGLIVDAAAQDTLKTQLINLRTRHGIEMTVVTLPSQAPYAPDMSLEAFATGLFNHWGIGDATRNDGIMVLVLPEDRAMRIELGAAYGQAWDNAAQVVVDLDFLPDFRAGDYQTGIINGTTSVIEKIALPFVGAAPRLDVKDEQQPWYALPAIIGIVALIWLRGQISNLFLRLRSCPKCGRKGTLRAVNETLHAATSVMPGRGQRKVWCTECDYVRVTPYHTSPIRISSGSSSSGSFGGGRSGGGGASGRW